MPSPQQLKKAKKGSQKARLKNKDDTKTKRQNPLFPTTISSAKDTDNNGLVDGSGKTAVQLYNDGAPLAITTKSGQTLSNQTSRKWSILAAADQRKGHLALVKNKQSRRSKHRVWTINHKGIIQSKGRWLSNKALSAKGFEDVFSIDFNGDGVIEDDTLIDAGDARYTLSGIAAVGETLNIQRKADDPDGNGKPRISWQSLTGGNSWTTIDTRKRLEVPTELDGSQIRARVDYTDGDGFQETVITSSRTIPSVDDGDAAFLIQGTPEVGQTLSINRSVDDPDGNGTASISWFQSTNGVTWFFASSNSTFTIAHALEGRRIAALVNYTDGQGFKESITTDARTIPYVDDGDAVFRILGTPAIGQTLGIGRIANDPDGNGSVEISWKASLDGRSWWDVSTSAQLRISSRIAGHQLKALVQYTDAQGFKESITTESVAIPGTAGFDPGNVDDYGNGPSTAGRLTVNNTATGLLNGVGDRDWFAINLKAGVRYQFDLEGNNLADPLLYLRSASSALIDYNDDKSAASLDAQIVYTAETNGTHYLDVGSYYDAYTGGYTLRATPLSAPDPDFRSTDGFGHVNAQRAFEQLLDVSLNSVDTLGGPLWGLDNINAPEVWRGGGTFAGATGRGATIAVIDSGVDLDHPEFTGRIVRGYDFVDGDIAPDDGNGHGTHVAGTIAAADDGIGITGVAHNANIMPLRVLNNDGYGWTRDIISAVRWAADNGADVINMSLGGGGYSQAMADAITYATEQGSVVVMAAGNSGARSPDFPAAYATTDGIAVGAVDRNRTLAGFSNRAGTTELDYVTAPGVNIYSAVPGGGYDTLNGTSMASPHVAGIAGLLKGHDRTLSPSTIEDLITGSASNASSSTTRNSGVSGGWSRADTITSQTLNQFPDSELRGSLIASLDGNGKQRRSTLRELKEGIQNSDAAYVGLDQVEVIDGSRNSFLALELSDGQSTDQRALLSNLLASDQFHYFEIEQKFSIV